MSTQDERPVYAERMFPAPVDLGIAQADRAVSRRSTAPSAYLEGEGGDGHVVVRGRRNADEKAVAEIVDLPADRRARRPRAIRSSR